MNHNAAFVVDEAALSEAVHEIDDAGAGGPDYGSQCLVRNLWKNDRLALLDSDLGQFGQDTCQAPFAVVKNLSAQRIGRIALGYFVLSEIQHMPSGNDLRDRTSKMRLGRSKALSHDSSSFRFLVSSYGEVRTTNYKQPAQECR